MCVIVSIFDSPFREKCLVFLRKASNPLASSLAVTHSFRTGAFVIHTHSQVLCVNTVSCLYMWVFQCVCVCVDVVCTCALCVHACDCVECSLSSCVPNWLWHICGFSRRIRAGAKLLRNQCNRLCSPPFPSYSPLFAAPQSAPLFLSLSLRVSVSSLSFFFSLCLAQSPY